MKTILKTIKGLLVGFIIIIPGISGSMIAAALNIYEDLISALSNIVKQPLKSLKSVWEYILGMIIGLALGVVFVSTIYNKYPIQLTALFIGLIVGGIPTLIRKNKGNLKTIHIITMIASMLIMASLLFIPMRSAGGNTGGKLVLYALMGFIMAGPIVVPGISGAMVLTMLGFYNQTMTTIKNFLKSLVTFEFSAMFNDMSAVLLMGIGGIIGLVVFAKVIKYILVKFPKYFNAVILGVLLIAPLSIGISLNKELVASGSSLQSIITTGNIAVGVIFLVFGFLLAYHSSDMKEKQVKSTEVVNILRTTKYMAVDSIIIVASYLLTVLIFDVIGYAFNFPELTASILTILLAKITLYYFLGLYKIIIKHLDYKNLTKIILLVILSNVLIVIILFIPSIPQFMYKSAYVFITAIEIAGFIAYRIFLKMYIYYREERVRSDSSIPTLIVGAGSAGEMALREINHNKRLNNFVVGFLDDDPRKLGRTIIDKPILGTIAEVNEIVEKYNILEVVFAISDYSRADFSKLTSNLKVNPNVKLRRILMVDEYIETNNFQIKDMKIDDLLERDLVSVNEKEIKTYIENETILITGGGGIVGQELARQVIKYNPKTIIILDVYENSAIEIEEKLLKLLEHEENSNTKVVTVVGSIYNENRMNEIFKKYKPTIIYHAAAYKHAGKHDDNIIEAVQTNIIGTKIICELANKYGAKKLALISTNRAVNPKSIMGITKRYAELVALYYNDLSETKISAIRFGSIIESNLSPVSIFKEQIEKGGPVLIADEKATRHLMSVEEAALLTLESISFSEGGEIFVFNMGEPINVLELAKKMIYLAGQEPYADILIKVVGLENDYLHDKLSSNDKLTKTPNSKVLVHKEKEINIETLKFDYLFKNYYKLNSDKLKEILEEAVGFENANS